MKLRRITRIRGSQVSYRFVDAETGAFYRNSVHAYTHAVLGRVDDHDILFPFSFHANGDAAHGWAAQVSGIDEVSVVTVEVEPS